jgi:hypothetical protein
MLARDGRRASGSPAGLVASLWTAKEEVGGGGLCSRCPAAGEEDTEAGFFPLGESGLRLRSWGEAIEDGFFPLGDSGLRLRSWGEAIEDGFFASLRMACVGLDIGTSVFVGGCVASCYGRAA